MPLEPPQMPASGHTQTDATGATGVVTLPNPSEYLEFAEVADTGKTKVWQVLSKRHGDVLAVISWHGPWRQYTFRPNPNTIWNTGCLTDVQAFIKRQMEARRGN